MNTCLLTCLLIRVALIYSAFLYILPSYAVFTSEMVKFTEAFVALYKRPFTILEICSNSEIYSLAIAQNAQKKGYDVTSVVVLLEKSPQKLAAVERAKLSNVLLLQPKKLTRDMLKNLARCEQPDMVIVHDIPAYAKSLSVTRNYLELYLDLGDYLFFNGTSADQFLLDMPQKKSKIAKNLKNSNGSGEFLAVFKTHKEGLMVPRWSTHNNFNSSTLQYKVISNFKQKSMYKSALKESSVWQKGINLLTFVMMNGIYPSHYHIKKQIEKLSSLKHNDLVIGNFLIQGYPVKPIDFNDKRRSIDVKRCLNALLEAFRYSSNVYEDPIQFYRYYQSLLLGDELED